MGNAAGGGGGARRGSGGSADEGAVGVGVHNEPRMHAPAAEEEVKDVDVLAAEDVTVCAVAAAVAVHEAGAGGGKERDVGAGAREPPRHRLALQRLLRQRQQRLQKSWAGIAQVQGWGGGQMWYLLPELLQPTRLREHARCCTRGCSRRRRRVRA